MDNFTLPLPYYMDTIMRPKQVIYWPSLVTRRQQRTSTFIWKGNLKCSKSSNYHIENMYGDIID